MYQKGDEEHIKVLYKIKENMKSQSPEKMKEWFENKRKEFDIQPSK